MSTWCTNSSRASSIMRRSRCTSTTCAATMRTTSARPSSRPLRAHCAARWSGIRAGRAPFLPPRGRSSPTVVRIAVVDYGMGNLRSVSKAIEHVAPQARVVVTSDPAVVESADRVVFPGQGAMPDCMREMDSRGLRGAILGAAARKPFLGICIGLQMLFEHSEEGDTPGLGVLRGNVVRFPDEAMRTVDGARLKVPHMGWNRVHHAIPHPLWGGIEDGA